jgi:hypothetical protein
VDASVSRLLALLLVLSLPAMAQAPSNVIDDLCKVAIPPVTRPAAPSGEVTIRWRFGVIPRCGYWGCATTHDDGKSYDIELRGAPPAFDDTCGLIVLGHEVTHAMGQRHP